MGGGRLSQWSTWNCTFYLFASGTPPDLPLAVMVRFDSYSGPTLPDQTIPIVPLRRTWLGAGTQCS